MGYSWNKKEIKKLYYKKLKNLLLNINKNNYFDLLDTKDMLHSLRKNKIDFNKISIITDKVIKETIDMNTNFINNNITEFQLNKIKSFLNVALDNEPLYYTNDLVTDKNDLIITTYNFFQTINKDISYLLLDMFNKSKIKTTNDENLGYAGITYYIDDENYIEISKNDTPIVILSHEMLHAYINTKGKNNYKDLDKKDVLYREVSSILVELYCNNYLLKKKKITSEEYTKNINSLLIADIYDNTEFIYLLLDLAEKNIYKYDDISKYIENKAKENPNFDIDISELYYYSCLSDLLIYFYANMIAIAIYENNKTNPKKGLDTAIDIMLNINVSNEEELFKKYDLRPEESLLSFIKTNNALVKSKRRN